MRLEHPEAEERAVKGKLTNNLATTVRELELDEKTGNPFNCHGNIGVKDEQQQSDSPGITRRRRPDMKT
jgi:hypothetical protein